MEEIVASERQFGRFLALLPAIAVGVCVRVLTLASVPLAGRVAAAAVVAMACWTSYRLLTAKLVVDERGVSVRGVFYDADIPWGEMQSAEIVPAAKPLRALVWGIMTPHALELRTSKRPLRPVVAIGASDDDEMRRAAGAIRARLGFVPVPAQRRSEDDMQVTGV